MQRTSDLIRMAVCVLCATAGLAAAAPQGAVMDADESRLLEKDTLRIHVAGCVTGSFERAYGVLQTSNLLETVQQAYAAQLPVGIKPQFEVKSAGAGRYYYVNKAGERCDIRELWRETDTNTCFMTAFYATGKRTFGTFESLIYLTLARDEQASPKVLVYTVSIRVWPQGALVRVFLRYLPGIDRYFRKKTADLETIFTDVFVGILQ